MRVEERKPRGSARLGGFAGFFLAAAWAVAGCNESSGGGGGGALLGVETGLPCSIRASDPNPVLITVEQAEAAALAGQPPGTRVLETELETENGCVVYEVELSNRLEIVVDAGRGEILQIENEDDEDDDDEEDDDEEDDD